MDSIMRRAKERCAKFGFKSRKAVDSSHGGLVAVALSIVALIIAVAIMFPIAGKLIFNANMTGWDSTSKTTFPVIFLVGVAVVIIAMIRSGFLHR